MVTATPSHAVSSVVEAAGGANTCKFAVLSAGPHGPLAPPVMLSGSEVVHLSVMLAAEELAGVKNVESELG
jgi:hypothetical protein